MNSDEAKEHVWHTPLRAFEFLLWAGLLSMPATCPLGHKEKWKPFGQEHGQSYMHCAHPILTIDLEDDDEDEDGNLKRSKHSACNKKKSWRKDKTLPKYLPVNITQQ